VKDPGVQPNDDNANIAFLLLNEDQYADFVGGHAGEALFSADASHDQDINVTLPRPRISPGSTTSSSATAPAARRRNSCRANSRLISSECLCGRFGHKQLCFLVRNHYSVAFHGRSETHYGLTASRS
jgi:hypothetical protein